MKMRKHCHNCTKSSLRNDIQGNKSLSHTHKTNTSPSLEDHISTSSQILKSTNQWDIKSLTAQDVHGDFSYVCQNKVPNFFFFFLNSVPLFISFILFSWISRYHTQKRIEKSKKSLKKTITILQAYPVT